MEKRVLKIGIVLIFSGFSDQLLDFFIKLVMFLLTFKLKLSFFNQIMRLCPLIKPKFCDEYDDFFCRKYGFF